MNLVCLPGYISRSGLRQTQVHAFTIAHVRFKAASMNMSCGFKNCRSCSVNHNPNKAPKQPANSCQWPQKCERPSAIAEGWLLSFTDAYIMVKRYHHAGVWFVLLASCNFLQPLGSDNKRGSEKESGNVTKTTGTVLVEAAKRHDNALICS